MKLIIYLALFVTAIVMLSGCAELPEDEKPQAIEVLVEGAPIHGTNGILFDSNDQLYIASIFDGEILVMDPETGTILERLGPESGVKGPDDLAFGPDGSLYYTNLFAGEVGRISADGVSTSQSISVGVNPITFSDDGRLFVATAFAGDVLYEIDPDLSEEPRIIAKDLGWLNGMDWGPDGFLYSPVWTTGEVVRIDVDSGSITTVEDGFASPSAVKFDSMGHLYVSDHRRGEIVRIDVQNASKEVISTGLFGMDNLAFDSQDRMFVSNAQNGSILEILPDGTARIVSPGGMIGPGGVAVYSDSGNESVFVADIFTLRKFDGQTGEEKQIERQYIAVPGSITGPMTVFPDGDNLVLSSWVWNSVQVWDLETRQVEEEYVDFALPLNAIRFQGDLVVAELGSEPGEARVVRATGEDRVPIADELVVPVGLAATDDDLWVSDCGAGTVLQIVENGNILPEPVPVATELLLPEGLAVGPDGNLLVVEVGNDRLLSIDLATGNVSIIAEDLEIGVQATPGTPPTYIFNDVAVSSSGVIYVTGDVSNVLYRIDSNS